MRHTLYALHLICATPYTRHTLYEPHPIRATPYMRYTLYAPHPTCDTPYMRHTLYALHPICATSYMRYILYALHHIPQVTKKQTNSMGHNPFWEANNFGISHEWRHFFGVGGGRGNVYIHCRVQKRPLFVPYLGQTNPLHVLPFCYFKIHLNIILPFIPTSWQWPLSFRLTHHNRASTCLPIRATCPAHFILLRTTGEQYKSWGFSLRNFLQSTVSRSLFRPTLRPSPVPPLITSTKQLIKHRNMI